MSEELYFNNELRNCLDAAVYSDCGENDQWNYWYQRLRKAHDAAVDRVTETQRAENAKLRELVADMWRFTGEVCKKYPRLFDSAAQGGQMVRPNMLDGFEQRMAELGIEVDA